MKYTKWIGAFLCLAGLSLALSPVETYGALSIKDAKLVDATGAPVTLRGMSLFWHYDLGGKEFWTASVVGYVQKDWHNSVIRAPIAAESHTIPGGLTAKGYMESPNDAMNKIHTIINAAIQYGSYVIVDWHTHNAQTASAIEFFTALAKEYKDTPNIIWEIFNEPTDGQALNHAKQVIPVIRTYSKNVIVVGSSGWSSNPQEFGTDLDSYKNIAYSMHFYSDHTFWDNVTAAMGKGHAVFATEWGMSSSSGDGGFQSTSTGNIGTWLSKLDANGVSSCNWSLGNATKEGAGVTPQTSAALQLQVTTTPGDDDPWTDASLTESGKSIRAWLRSKNTAWTWSDNTLKIISPLAITSAKKTDLIIKQDSIKFSAAYNTDVSWTLKETGRTSKATKSNPPGTTKYVSAAHLAGLKDLTGSTAFQRGETVDVTLEPLAQKVSYTLSPDSTGTILAKRVHETNLQWIGSRLFLPLDLVEQGKRVQVSLRNAKGQSLFQASATVGGFNHLDLGPRPKSEGLQILDVTSDDVVIRSQMAPNF